MRWLLVCAVAVLVGCIALQRASEREPVHVQARPPSRHASLPASLRASLPVPPRLESLGLAPIAEDERADDSDAAPVLDVDDAVAHLAEVRALEANLRLDGLLHGRVSDASTAEPIAGATVIAMRDDREVTAVITDSDGWYRFVLPAGDYAITIYFVDHVSMFRDVRVPTGRSATLFARLAVALDRVVTFSGVTANENTYILEED